MNDQHAAWKPGTYPASDIDVWEGRIPSRPKQPPCKCTVYAFPHRLGSGKCGEQLESREQHNQELLRDFDRTEAQAINASAIALRF
jgi:hypothetical protein